MTLALSHSMRRSGGTDENHRGQAFQDPPMIITPQLPISKWHEVIDEKTIADPLLDRIDYDAQPIELKGE